MKKITGYFIISALVAFNCSCQKEEEDKTVTKTINVTLQMNESYSVRVMNAGDEDDVMAITKQASHSSLSEITSISGSKDVLFNYSPVAEYIGTDEVQITNTEGEHQGGGHGHGNCSGGGHHHDETTVYVYKITINGNNHRVSISAANH